MTIRTTSTRVGSMLILLAAVTAIAACDGAAAAAPTSSESPQAAASASPSMPVGPSSVPAPTPTSNPSPMPPPRHDPPKAQAAKPTWSQPHRIFQGAWCAAYVAVIDGSSRYHVAAECGQRIRYATSTNGTTWKTATFKNPLHRFDVDPQISVDGRTLYIAFTRLRPTDGACGDDGLVDVGVLYRTRTLPSGKWSAPVQVGKAGDHLQSLRVVDGVIHETVITNEEQGPVFYASQHGATHRRVLIKGAQQTSLRVGDDGRARVAFTTEHSVKIATIGSGVRVSTHTVFAATDVYTRSPVLVLGANDTAYLAWTATTWSGGGCTDGDYRAPHEGTWFATNAAGRWERKRLTPDATSASLAADVASGQVHVLYSDRRGHRFVTRAADGTWSGSRLAAGLEMQGLILRYDPATGRFLAVGSLWRSGDSTEEIYALVRR
jgi:hypothetical protein